MPSLTGLTLGAAAARAAAAGLHIVSAEDLNLSAPASATPTTTSPTPSATPDSTPPAAAPPATTAQTLSVGTVVTQFPAAGHRVVKGDPVHITLTN